MVSTLVQDNTRFRNLWVGQTISLLGDQVSMIAFPLIAVLALHAGPAQLGLLTAIQMAPNLLFALHAGAWLDRGGRHRRALIAADLGRAIALLTIPGAYALGRLGLLQLCVVGFLVGSLGVVFRIGYPTLQTSAVERDDYVAANQWYNGSRAFAYMAGPSIGGLIVQALSAPVAIVMDAVSFLGSALFLRRTEEPPLSLDPGPAPRTLEGLRMIVGDALLRASLLASTVLSLCNYAVMAIYVLFMTRSLHFSPAAIGFVLGAGAAGGLVGSVATKRVAEWIGLGPAYILGFFLFSTPIALIPAAHGSKPTEYVMVIAAEVLSGIGLMLLDILGGSLFQALVPDRLRSRFMGAFTLVNYGIRPFGALLGGTAGAVIGLRTTLWIAVAGGILSGFILLLSPTRHVRDLPPAM